MACARSSKGPDTDFAIDAGTPPFPSSCSGVDANVRALTLRAAQAFANVGDGAVLAGYFDQLSRKQQSSVLAASANDLQDGFGGDQVPNGGLAHPDLCAPRGN